MSKNQRKDTYQSPSQTSQKTVVDDPLLKVPDKGTSLGFTVCKVRPLSALTPSPSPTAWERGAARSVFGVLKRQLQRGRKLRFRTP